MRRSSPKGRSCHCSRNVLYMSLLAAVSLYTLCLYLSGYLSSGLKLYYSSDDPDVDLVIELPEMNERGIPIEKHKRPHFSRKMNPGWKLLYPRQKVKWAKKTHHEIFNGAWVPPLDHYNRTYNHSPGYVNETDQFCLTDTDRHPVVLFVFVESAPSNQRRRLRWREKWGFRQEWLRIAFVLGLSASDELNDAIIEENEKYQDIILLNYTDTYGGLTTKTTTMLKWISDNCAHAKFVLKTDDDVMVYFDTLRDHMDKINDGTLLYQGQGSSPQPFRKKSKWIVSYNDYPFEKYPDYILGSGILMSMNTVLTFYNQSRHIPFFPFEDVYLGFCSVASKIHPTIFNKFQNFEKSDKKVGWFVKQFVSGKLILAHGIRPKMMETVWNILEKRKSNVAHLKSP